MDPIVVALKNKLERTPRLDGADEFFKIYKEVFTYVQDKDQKNKKIYLHIQNALIIISAVVSGLNILITLMSTIKVNIPYIVPILSGLASVATVVSTALMKHRDFKKFFETWMRHSANLFKIKTETSNYMFGIGDYSNVTDQDAFKMFIGKWSEIQKENYNNFSSNMSTFETEFADNTKNAEKADARNV